jgi:hypothetical protein
MKCSECRFAINGRCELRLPPFVHASEADRVIRDGDGCDFGRPLPEVTV